MLWYLLLAFLLGYTVANHNAPKEKNDHIRSPPRANTNEALPASGAQGQTTPASQFSSSAKNTGHDSVPSPTSPTMTVRGRPVKGCGSGDRAKDWVVRCWDDDAPDITPMSPARGSLSLNANVGVRCPSWKRSLVEPFRLSKTRWWKARAWIECSSHSHDLDLPMAATEQTVVRSPDHHPSVREKDESRVCWTSASTALDLFVQQQH